MLAPVLSSELSGNAIVICVGGVEVTRTYRKWHAVIEQLMTATNRHMVLLGSSNGATVAIDLMSRFLPSGRVHNLVEKTSLAQAHQVMTSSCVVVCADGGLMHLAASTTTPVVSLFASSIDPHWRLAPGTADDAIRSFTLDINDISPDTVVAAVVSHI